MSNKNKNLVFSSVGDNNPQIGKWIHGTKNYDILIVYYGNHKNKYKSVSDYYFERLGSKWQNIHYIVNNHPHIINQYKDILLLDDDIILSPYQINQLFDIRKQYKLDILAPAFRNTSKISHQITRVNPLYLLRYTNFVENCNPLMKKEILLKFMHKYNPILFDYGTDYWYINTLGDDTKNKVAIIDEITCVNPHDFFKKGTKRETERIQSLDSKIQIWNNLKKIHSLKNIEPIEYSFEKKSLIKIFKSFIQYYFYLPIGLFYRLLNSFL